MNTAPIETSGLYGEHTPVRVSASTAPLSTLAGDAEDTRKTLLRIHEAILLSDLRFVHPAHPDTWSKWADAVLDAAILLDKADRAGTLAGDAGEVVPVAWRWRERGQKGWRVASSPPDRDDYKWNEIVPLYSADALTTLSARIAELEAKVEEAGKVIAPFANCAIDKADFPLGEDYEAARRWQEGK